LRRWVTKRADGGAQYILQAVFVYVFHISRTQQLVIVFSFAKPHSKYKPSVFSIKSYISARATPETSPPHHEDVITAF
jgi:hypothetical protein